MGNRAGKGSQFERDTCRQLSLWFSGGLFDDWFWRTDSSGARATSRAKVGKRTIGNYGDIAATCPEGKPLTDFFTLELKRGYNKASPFDLLDRSKTAATQIWEEWIIKARRDARRSGSRSWSLIQRRDRHEACIWMPEGVAWDLDLTCDTSLSMTVELRKRGRDNKTVKIWGTLLDQFLVACPPERIKERLHGGDQV